GALWSADVLRVPEARIRRGPDCGARADARNFRLDGRRRRRTGGLAAALRAQGANCGRRKSIIARKDARTALGEGSCQRANRRVSSEDTDLAPPTAFCHHPEPERS